MASAFYTDPVAKNARSWMNVPFTLAKPDLDKAFCAEAAKAGLVNLEGHRSVGGMRASIYNAMPHRRRRRAVSKLHEGLRDAGTHWQRRGDLAMRFKIQTLNNISIKGLERLPRERFEVASDINNPDAILVRSADMHKLALPDSLRAVGRAGAGTNNIPVEALSKKRRSRVQRARRQCQRGEGTGAGRHVPRGAQHHARPGPSPSRRAVTITPSTWRWRRARRISSASSCRAARSASSGLGAIGVEVANSALGLGMKVLGYDPQITVQRAWQLSSNVEQALSLDDLFVRSDVISVHVPLTPETRGLVNEARLKLMRKNGVILNFARAAHRRREGHHRGARRRPPAGLRLRLPDQCAPRIIRRS